MTVAEFTPIIFGAALVAGFIGSLTGLGGGMIITPVLTIFLGVDIRYAIGAADGLFGFDEAVQEVVEFGLAFDFCEDLESAAEAVGETVLRDCFFAGGRFWPAAFLCIRAIRRDLFGSCHEWMFPFGFEC